MELRPIGCGQRRIAIRQLCVGFAAVCSLAILSLSANAQTPTRRLPGSISPLLQQARLAGKPQPAETIQLSLSFPLRNQAQLETQLQKVYDPNDPLFGHYLTSAEFTAQYGPTQADYDAVSAYVRAHGLTIINTTPSRALLGVEGSVQQIQAAFGVTLKQYQLADGRVVRAPSADPVLPAAIADKLEGIIGLDNAPVIKSFSHIKPADPLGFLNPAPALNSPFSGVLGAPPAGGSSPGGGSPIRPNATGSGPGNGYTPDDIKTVYNFVGTPLTGAGQTLAVFELDGYTPEDIQIYEGYYGLPDVPLQNILVDGYSGAPSGGGGAVEVTLDIQLQIALAPGINKILVYEAPPALRSFVDLYNRIATDNLAKNISTSWGVNEIGASSSMLNSENTAFRRMAMQGQTIFAASGDSGSKADGTNLGPTDPSTQPWITGVGGTTLNTLTTRDPLVPMSGMRSTEVAWSGSGGGISTVWPIPSYQSAAYRPSPAYPLGFITNAALGSKTMRNAPDIALNADGNTGYSIVFGGNFYIAGGTSCASPLWAAVAALSNQQRVALNKPTLGFFNAYAYRLATSSPVTYANDFFDIISGNNGSPFYPAVASYDLATGLGSINNGLLLLTDLNSITIPPPAPPVELLVNGGFENGAKKPQPWIATLSVINNFGQEAPAEGLWKAWLCGYGAPHTDTLKYPSVTIPSTVNSATLSFALHIDSQEDPLGPAYDTMQVQLLKADGTLLKRLATYSNVNFNTGFVMKSFDVTAYKGQTLQIYLTATEDGTLGTNFVVDAFSLQTQ